MKVFSIAAATAVLSIGTVALAQTTPSSSPTSPSAASSPHQRDATSSSPDSSSNESMTGGDTSPAAASTPHQQQALGADKSGHKAGMKDCISKQQAANSGMSKDDAKKACQEKMQGDSSR